MTHAEELVAAQETTSEAAGVRKAGQTELRGGSGDCKKWQSEDGCNGELHCDVEGVE